MVKERENLKKFMKELEPELNQLKMFTGKMQHAARYVDDFLKIKYNKFNKQRYYEIDETSYWYSIIKKSGVENVDQYKEMKNKAITIVDQYKKMKDKAITILDLETNQEPPPKKRKLNPLDLRVLSKALPQSS